MVCTCLRALGITMMPTALVLPSVPVQRLGNNFAVVRISKITQPDLPHDPQKDYYTCSTGELNLPSLRY